MSNLSNTPGGGDLPDRFRNVGEQIQAFFDYAEKNPDRAVPFFVNIWQTQASLTTRALALQGLGVAAKHYRVKEAFADWEVLKDIAKEVKGKGEVSNDLTRWAAATALEAIGYSQQSLQNLQGGGFTEPLDRIRREIRDRKLAEINRIQRLNSRGEPTAEYQRNLEFWLYGPVEELFAGNDHSPNYQELVGDVVHDLHGRGVYLGLRSSNRIVHGAALREAELIFKESAEIEDFIYGLLEKFLDNSNNEIALRIYAAEIINTTTDLSRRLKTLSQLLLEKSIELRNAAVRLLTPYKHDLTRVEPDADTILKALVFSYSLDTLQKPQLQDLTSSQLETYFSSAGQYHREISELFTNAIAASESLARRYGRSSSILKHFLQNKQEEYLSALESWLQLLREQIAETETEQRKVQSNQLLINETVYGLTNYYVNFRFDSKEIMSEYFKTINIQGEYFFDSSKFGFYSTNYYTYSHSKKNLSDLKKIQLFLIKNLNANEKCLSNYNFWSALSTAQIIPRYYKPIMNDIYLSIMNCSFQEIALFFIIYLGLLIITAQANLAGLGMILIVTTIGINFILPSKLRATQQKRLKDLQSILYKLNTQWQE